jgi:hypothetical protein
MIYNINYSNGDRTEIINYILSNKKNNSNYQVIDVGGSYGGWSTPYVDAIVDFNDIKSNNINNIIFFKIDITNPNDYDELLSYIEKNGKFDFCVCTHTLEDIMNPIFVCEQIEKISNEGYISFPSKYAELSRIEGNYRGYIHHRWIFNPKDDYILGFPKINYIEDNKFDKIANNSINLFDLSFYWKNKINIKYVNNNYLGPSVNHVIQYYNDLFL